MSRYISIKRQNKALDRFIDLTESVLRLFKVIQVKKAKKRSNVEFYKSFQIMRQNEALEIFVT